MNKKKHVTLTAFVCCSLLGSCNTKGVPYTGLVLTKTSLQSLDKNVVVSGDVIQIKGKNFDTITPSNNVVQVRFDDGSTQVAVIKSASEDSLSFYTPFVYTQSEDMQAEVRVILDDKPASGTLSFNLKVPEFAGTQLQLIQALRFHFMQGAEPQAIAQTLDQYIRQIVSEQVDAQEAIKQIDQALVLSAQSLGEKLKLLDSISLIPETFKSSRTGSFQTQQAPIIAQPFRIQQINSAPCEEEDRITDVDDFVVFYVNGMMTTLGKEYRSFSDTTGSQLGYCYTKKLIKDKVNGLGISAKVTGMYQYSLLQEHDSITGFVDSKVNDLKVGCDETYKKLEEAKANAPWYDWAWKHIEQAAVITVCRPGEKVGEIVSDAAPDVASAVAIAGDLTEALFSRLDTSGYGDYVPDAEQEEELIRRLEALTYANKRTAVIAHSQGNLLLTSVLRKMLLKAENNNQFSNLHLNIPSRLNTQPIQGPVTGAGSTLRSFQTLQLANGRYLTREQILYSIGVIWVASPVRIENPSRLTSSQYCSPTQLAPTCYSSYVGVRQDPVAQLRWVDDGVAAGGILFASGAAAAGAGIGAGTGNAARGAVIGGGLLGGAAAFLIKDHAFQVVPNRYFGFDNYAETMLYSPYLPKRVLLEHSMRKSESQSEKLDFSFEHHSMDEVYLGGLTEDQNQPNHPLFTSSGSTVTPWQKIKEALIEFSDKLAYPQRNHVDITIE